MANTIRDYSATPANNTVVDGADISEGCSPAGINDAIRGVMADLKDVSTGAVALESPAADSLSVTGNVSAATFSGDGSSLTGIPTPTLTSLGIANHDDITVDGSGNVDVTGTVTASDLVLNAGTASSVFFQDSTATNGYQIRANVSSSVDGGLLIEDLSGGNIARFESDGDISFYEDTGTNAKFFWDASAERLGIGTSSPVSALDVVGDIGYNGRLKPTDAGANGTETAPSICVGYDFDTGFFRAGTNTIGVTTGATERLRIDSSGRVTMPYQPAFVALDNRGQGQQAIANVNISQYFTTAQTNIGNGFSTSTGRFTAPVAGYYVFGWNLFTTGISADTQSRVSIIKNGNSSAGEWSGGDRVGHANQGSIGIYLSANDYVVLGTQGGSYTAYWYSQSQHSRFWGYLVA